MSKIGKKMIPIPAGVEISVSGLKVHVKGPKGEISRDIPEGFSITNERGVILVTPSAPPKKDTRALWGTLRQHIANMVHGVTFGFEKKLEFEGIGLKAEILDKNVVLSVGLTHPVRIPIPDGVYVSVAKNIINITGVDKDSVGQFAANIRKARLPEPYKGTGIRYAGEIIKRKAGKKLAGTAT